MSEVFKKYVPTAFIYISAKKVDIAKAAQDLGISATAIGAAIAKENDAYETRQGAVWFMDRRLDDYVKLQTYRLGNTMLRSEATAVTTLGLDEQLKGTAGKALKFAFPTLADVGITNIKVSTAIKLLDDYLANYPADPLGLKDYRNDTGRFVRDLIDPRTPVTALVSALMVKEAQDFYLKPAVDGQGRQLNIDAATWGDMSPEVRDGLTTMYFTMGKNVMEVKRADNIARNGVYDPRLGEGDSGGLWTAQNAAEIGAALGVTGYGETPINGLTLESNTTFINLPNLNAGSSGFISYANDYSVRINAGGTLSHIVAAEAAKGNIISVADLRAVNYDIGDVADTAIPSGAVLLVPKRVGDSLVVDSGNARISFNPTTGEYLAITQSSANGPAFIYERKLVSGTLVDRFIQSDNSINGLDLTDGNPTTLPVSLTDLADHTGGSLLIGDERAGSQLIALASEGNGNYEITAEIGGQSVSLGAVADNDSDNVRVTGISSINDHPLDTLGTGTYGLDADDYLSFGLTFNNLLNGTVGAAGEALIAGLDPAAQAATGAPVPQVQITLLSDGQTWRSLEVAGGTTFSTLRDDEGNVISATYSRELGAGVKLSEVYDGANTLLYTEKIEPLLTGANAGQLKETLIRPDGSGFVFQRGVDGQEIADTRVRVAPYDQRLASTFSDVPSFIDAIKSGKPLPIVANGLRLLNDLDQLYTPGGSLPQLGTANTIAAGALSLYNLNNALKHGDAFDKLSATAFALNGTTNALIAAGVISKTGAAANLLGAGSSLASALPYLGLISSIKAGDPIGMAQSIGMLVNPAFLSTPLGWVLIGVQLLRSFMDKGPPDAWGTANVSFGPGITNYLSQINATGENFGPDRVRGQLQSTLDALNSLISQTNSGNPDTNQHLGIIPQRLPSLNYRASEFADKGYAITDIDALTGARRFHNVRFDDSGQVFNINPADVMPELRAMLSISGATGYSPFNIAPEMIAACGRDMEGRGRCSSRAGPMADSGGWEVAAYVEQAANQDIWRKFS